jgi:NTP pyrophosphatase (non-canonical NTP hydrolase)
MEFKQVEERALQVRNKYRQLETARLGREWTVSELTEGFVGDVGSLMKLVMAKSGVRVVDDVDEKLREEICDCLWATICIANKLNIDLESEFTKKMDVLENRIENSLKDPTKAD